MKSGRTKIQVTKSTVEGLHFVDIYIPKVENDGYGGDFTVFHHEDYIHICFPTENSPSVIYKPCEPEKRPLEEIMWAKYDLEDFMTREFKENLKNA